MSEKLCTLKKKGGGSSGKVFESGFFNLGVSSKTISNLEIGKTYVIITARSGTGINSNAPSISQVGTSIYSHNATFSGGAAREVFNVYQFKAASSSVTITNPETNAGFIEWSLIEL